MYIIEKVNKDFEQAKQIVIDGGVVYVDDNDRGVGKTTFLLELTKAKSGSVLLLMSRSLAKEHCFPANVLQVPTNILRMSDIIGIDIERTILIDEDIYMSKQVIRELKWLGYKIAGFAKERNDEY